MCLFYGNRKLNLPLHGWSHLPSNQTPKSTLCWPKHRKILVFALPVNFSSPPEYMLRKLLDRIFVSIFLHLQLLTSGFPFLAKEMIKFIWWRTSWHTPCFLLIREKDIYQELDFSWDCSLFFTLDQRSQRDERVKKTRKRRDLWKKTTSLSETAPIKWESPESGLFYDWLVEVQTVKRREDSIQICLNNFQRNLVKMAERFVCCKTFWTSLWTASNREGKGKEKRDP